MVLQLNDFIEADPQIKHSKKRMLFGQAANYLSSIGLIQKNDSSDTSVSAYLCGYRGPMETKKPVNLLTGFVQKNSG